MNQLQPVHYRLALEVVVGHDVRSPRLGRHLLDAPITDENAYYGGYLRLALVKRQSGMGSPSDLTLVLERARAIGDHVDQRLAAVADVQALLE